MNRYTAEGIVNDMRAGRTVLVLCDLRGAIRDGMGDVIAVAGVNKDERISTANGHESIRQVPGPGRVIFSSVHSNLRGMAPDVVVLDADPYGLGEMWWLDFTHGVGRKAEVIRR